MGPSETKSVADDARDLRAELEGYLQALEGGADPESVRSGLEDAGNRLLEMSRDLNSANFTMERSRQAVSDAWVALQARADAIAAGEATGDDDYKAMSRGDALGRLEVLELRLAELGA